MAEGGPRESGMGLRLHGVGTHRFPSLAQGRPGGRQTLPSVPVWRKYRSWAVVLGPSFGRHGGARLSSQVPHLRRDKEISSLSLGSSIWEQKTRNPIALSWNSGIPLLPQINTSTHNSSVISPPQRPCLGDLRGSSGGTRAERQVCRGTPLRDAGWEAGGGACMLSAAGNGKPGK